MKKEYMIPELDIKALLCSDIISTSGVDDTGIESDKDNKGNVSDGMW